MAGNIWMIWFCLGNPQGSKMPASQKPPPCFFEFVLFPFWFFQHAQQVIWHGGCAEMQAMQVFPRTFPKSILTTHKSFFPE